MVLFEIAKGRYTVYAIGKKDQYCPLLDFLTSIGSNLQKDADQILALLQWVSQKGPPRNIEASKPLKEDLFEFKQGRLRVLWFYDEGKMILCTHGFIKKSQKTSSSEIEQAVSIRGDYLKEKKKGPFKIVI
jgi:phage-related protein